MDELRDRNVYILGAGFSAPAGVPVIHDFIDRSRIYFDDPSTQLDQIEREHFRRFLDFKRKMSQAREKVKIDLDNIEELFGLVEISQRLGNESVVTRDSTVYVIAKTLELATRSQRAGTITFYVDKPVFQKTGRIPAGFSASQGFGEGVLEADMYVYFASLAGGLLDDPDREQARRNAFVTFNYDLLLEQALRKVGITPDYCLLGRQPYIEPEEAGRARIPVLKLHGSTNWGICRNCRAHVDVLSEKVTESPAEFRARVCPECGQQTFQPMLIPPSWDKSEYREIMKPIWSRALEELRLASRICIIGYSMRQEDSFFKYLMALALAENHNLYRFIVVDRDPKIASRYKRLLEPIFRERRFYPAVDPMGLSAFLCHGRSCEELGRGEIVGSNLSRR